MFTAVTTRRFEKDIKLARRRGKNFDKLYEIMALLLAGKKLPVKNFDHPLTGNYINRRECHLEPDWLLIYKVNHDEIIFERTGTHADLFG